MSMETHRSLMRGVAESYSRGDAESAAALFAPDGSLEDVATGHILEGREAIRTYCQGFFGAWPDLHIEIVNQSTDESCGAQEWIMSATHASDALGFPASGKKFSVRGVSFFQFQDGHILRSRDYFDLGAIARQIAP